MLDKKLVERVEEPTGRFVITCLHCGHTWKSAYQKGGRKTWCTECGGRIDKDLWGVDYTTKAELVEGRCWVERYEWDRRYKHSRLPRGVRPILKQRDRENGRVPFPCRFQAYHYGIIGTFDFITDAQAAVEERMELLEVNKKKRERDFYASL